MYFHFLIHNSQRWTRPSSSKSSLFGALCLWWEKEVALRKKEKLEILKLFEIVSLPRGHIYIFAREWEAERSQADSRMLIRKENINNVSIHRMGRESNIGWIGWDCCAAWYVYERAACMRKKMKLKWRRRRRLATFKFYCMRGDLCKKFHNYVSSVYADHLMLLRSFNWLFERSTLCLCVVFGFG